MYKRFFNIRGQSALTLIFTPKDPKSHPYLILPQLPRNSDNNDTPRKHLGLVFLYNLAQRYEK